MGMLNAIGLQNPGVEHVVDRILPTLDFTETRFFANVCGSTIDDYVEVTRRFDDSAIDAIEINISCPNIKEGGVQFGNVPEMSARVVAACRAVTTSRSSPSSRPTRRTSARARGVCIEAGSDGARRDQHDDGHGDRREDTAAGHRQHAGRALGPGHQADRTAQGDAGGRGRAAARHPDHRPGRHPDRRRTRSSSSSRARRRSASGPRCSTIRSCARRSTPASREYLAANGMASVGELVGSLDAPARTIQACYC